MGPDWRPGACGKGKGWSMKALSRCMRQSPRSGRHPLAHGEPAVGKAVKTARTSPAPAGAESGFRPGRFPPNEPDVARSTD